MSAYELGYNFGIFISLAAVAVIPAVAIWKIAEIKRGAKVKK